MTRIVCHYEICVFNRDQICTSKEIEYDPDQGCLTAQDRAEFEGVLDDEDELEEEEEDTFLHEEEEFDEEESDEEEGGEEDNESDLEEELGEDEDF